MPRFYTAALLVVFSLFSHTAFAQDEVRCKYKQRMDYGPLGCQVVPLDKAAYLLMPRLDEQLHATALADDRRMYANY
jgi:hypothetical protein